MQERRLTLPHSPVSLAVACFLIAGMLLLVPRGAAAQDVISGTVVSADDGEALPGVNVVVVGTNVGTATSTDGEYTLEGVPAEADSVQFSFVGYETQTEAIAGRSTIDVVLSPAAEELGEMVVIGYGEESEALLTESTESVSAEQISETPVSSPEQALQGRVSGVQITSAGASPDAPTAVRVRGVGTVGNTQPLFVIDGVPVGRGGNASVGGKTTNPLSTLNPENIESISVLKDASAAAVYGVRAANGVVLIETKQGSEQEPTINFDSYAGIQNVQDTWDMNSTEEYAALIKEAYNNFNEQKGLSPGDDNYQAVPPELQEGSPLLDREVDWIGEAVNQSAPIQKYNVSMSVGGGDLSYYLSGGYFEEQSNVPQERLKRYSLRINTDYQINDWISIGENLSVSYKDGFSGRAPRTLASEAARIPPVYRIYDRDNSIEDNRYGYDGNVGTIQRYSIQNPIARYNLNELDNATTRLLGDVHAEVSILDELTFESKASLDLSESSFQRWQFAYERQEIGISGQGNTLRRSESRSSTQVYTNSLRYNDDFNDHSVEVLALAEAQLISSSSVNGSRDSLASSDPNFRIVGNGVNPSINGSRFEENFLGFVGRLKYDYADKYLLTASVRRDGSSRFAPGNRWGTFPSVSVAWRIGEEPFMEAVPAVSSLKLRGSWGQLGNALTIAPFPHIFRVDFYQTYGTGNNFFPVATPDEFVNESITWETVETTDFGVSGGFFNDALTFEATYYRRLTRDLLFDRPVPAATGFTSAPVNLGNVRNTGVELSAGFEQQLGDVNVNISGNLTTVNNELTELREGADEFQQQGVYRTAVGEPIGYFFGYETDGLYQEGDDDLGELTDQIAGPDFANQQPGDVRFVDQNDDGVIDASDRVRLGKTTPDFHYGFNLDLRWKGVDLGLFFQGEEGISRFNEFRQRALSLDAGSGRNQLAAVQDRWTPQNTDTDIPRAIYNDPNANLRENSDLFIEDASYLRLKNVQLGYRLPSSLVSGVLQQARIYVSATNLFTATPYSGLSPTARNYNAQNSVGEQLQAGTDQGFLPSPRTYRVGLQVTL